MNDGATFAERGESLALSPCGRQSERACCSVAQRTESAHALDAQAAQACANVGQLNAPPRDRRRFPQHFRDQPTPASCITPPPDGEEWGGAWMAAAIRELLAEGGVEVGELACAAD